MKHAKMAIIQSAAFLASGGFIGMATAGPANGVVQGGSATITTSAATTTITQNSNRAVIDWQSFNIAAGEAVVFNQPNAQSAVLNRVTGSQLSSLEGTLTANGQVYLVNPNGILIGKRASIDTAAFVAATAGVAATDFMKSAQDANGRYAFDQVTTASKLGSIVNAGTITAADGGFVALVAPAVRNSGLITARLGKIVLASANIFTLDLYGDDLVRLAVSDKIAGALTDAAGSPVSSQVSVDGQLRADGGRVVLLTVPAAAGIVNSAINLSGIARAQTVATGTEGQILLLANGGDINVGGSIDATAPVAGLTGGSIEAFGSNVHLLATASLDASGAGGGGFVAVGGRLGYGSSTLDTVTTSVDYGASIAACGSIVCAMDGSGGTGSGGTVRLYSSGGTVLDGKINISSAQGAVAGTTEILSNLGTTTLGPMSQIIANTGTGNVAGFAVIMGDELSIAQSVQIDMRDYAGTTPASAEHFLFDPSQPSLRTYAASNDLVNLPTLQTNSPIVFHAYNPNAQATYQSQLPIHDLGIEADGFYTPVGALRPNGGAPTTLASVAADALAEIPVPPGGGVPPTGNVPPAGSADEVTQLSDASNRVAQSDAQGNSAQSGAGPAPFSAVVGADAGEMQSITGGPGVARLADLGRIGGVPGALADVFGVNYHVVAPAGGSADAPMTDYLCKTPFARNGCRTR